jgi:hypothetical protein
MKIIEQQHQQLVLEGNAYSNFADTIKSKRTLEDNMKNHCLQLVLLDIQYSSYSQRVGRNGNNDDEPLSSYK